MYFAQKKDGNFPFIHSARGRTENVAKNRFLIRREQFWSGSIYAIFHGLDKNILEQVGHTKKCAFCQNAFDFSDCSREKIDWRGKVSHNIQQNTRNKIEKFCSPQWDSAPDKIALPFSFLKKMFQATTRL